MSYPDDPNVRATVSRSGFAIPDFGEAISHEYSGSNFTFVAKAMGCDFCDGKLELDRMRRIPFQRIENFVGRYADNGTKPALSFVHGPDGRLVFENYFDQYATGRVVKLPMIYGTTARESLTFYPPQTADGGPNPANGYNHTLSIVCGAHNSSIARHDLGLPVYRYQWAGNFTNIDVGRTWLGAWHASDQYMFFGSYLSAPGTVADLETENADAMQDLLAAFIIDPFSLESKGWPQYDVYQQNDGKLLRFGADGQAVQVVGGDDVEGACHIPGAVYNSAP